MSEKIEERATDKAKRQLIKINVSGHAAGPVAAVMSFFGLPAVPLTSLIPLTNFTHLAAKSHDF